MPQGYQTVIHYFYQLVPSPTTAVCVEGDLEVVTASLRVGGNLVYPHVTILSFLQGVNNSSPTTQD